MGGLSVIWLIRVLCLCKRLELASDELSSETWDRRLNGRRLESVGDTEDPKLNIVKKLRRIWNKFGGNKHYKPHLEIRYKRDDGIHYNSEKQANPDTTQQKDHQIESTPEKTLICSSYQNNRPDNLNNQPT